MAAQALPDPQPPQTPSGQAPPANAPPAQAPPVQTPPVQAPAAKAPLSHTPPMAAQALPDQDAVDPLEAAEGDKNAMADFEASLHDTEDEDKNDDESTSSVADTLEAPEGWDAAVKAAGLAKTAKQINRLTTEKVESTNMSAPEDEQELREVSSFPTTVNATSASEQRRAPIQTVGVDKTDENAEVEEAIDQTAAVKLAAPA